jgi:hypothetical protein
MRVANLLSTVLLVGVLAATAHEANAAVVDLTAAGPGPVLSAGDYGHFQANPNQANGVSDDWFFQLGSGVTGITGAAFNWILPALGMEIDNLQIGIFDPTGTTLYGSFVASISTPGVGVQYELPFLSLGPGTYKVHVDGDVLSPNFQGFYIGDIHAVPLPAAVWLLGSALVGFIAVGRRKAG